MALQSSGPISLGNVQNEFGGSVPISISEYYGVDTVPGSGQISLSNFYGTSAILGEQDVYFTDTVSPNIITLNGNLGDANCDFYVYNNQRLEGTALTSWGLNSVGENYPAWAGGPGGLQNNSSMWVMVEAAPGINPNDWDWFHLEVWSSGQSDYWRYSNVSWAPADFNTWYLTGGDLWGYTGPSSADFTNVSGPYPSLANHLALFWNGTPSIIDLSADIRLATGP